jgi:hypothetical protein
VNESGDGWPQLHDEQRSLVNACRPAEGAGLGVYFLLFGFAFGLAALRLPGFVVGLGVDLAAGLAFGFAAGFATFRFVGGFAFGLACAKALASILFWALLTFGLLRPLEAFFATRLLVGT